VSASEGEINFGSQIANSIRMKLVGLAHQLGQHKVLPKSAPEGPMKTLPGATRT
jgi:hypothetical protein